MDRNLGIVIPFNRLSYVAKLKVNGEKFDIKIDTGAMFTLLRVENFINIENDKKYNNLVNILNSKYKDNRYNLDFVSATDHSINCKACYLDNCLLADINIGRLYFALDYSKPKKMIDVTSGKARYQLRRNLLGMNFLMATKSEFSYDNLTIKSINDDLNSVNLRLKTFINFRDLISSP